MHFIGNIGSSALRFVLCSDTKDKINSHLVFQKASLHLLPHWP